MSIRQTLIFGKIFFIALFFCGCHLKTTPNDKFVSLIIDPQTSNVEFFWLDANGTPLKNFQNLKNHLAGKNKRLRLAMNGGMYENGNQPKGLFIENRVLRKPLDQSAGAGNFYLPPNGVFYLTADNQAGIVQTPDFQNNGNIQFATQSGPLLVIDGKINSAFAPNSTNLNVRNGVGILPDGKIVMAISRSEVNFYEFARYFQQLNCRQALYLDGFVSRMYLPEQNIAQLDGDFAVIIGVTD